MREEKTITITAKKYVSLLISEARLEMLEGASVDNWCGYSYALYPKYGDNIDDIEKQIKEKYL